MSVQMEVLHFFWFCCFVFLLVPCSKTFLNMCTNKEFLKVIGLKTRFSEGIISSREEKLLNAIRLVEKIF